MFKRNVPTRSNFGPRVVSACVCAARLQVLRHGIECFGAASSAAWLHHARYGSLPWVGAGRLSAVTVPGVYLRGEKYMT